MILKPDFIVFCGIAVALHVGIAALAERPATSVPAAGSDGITAAAAAGDLAALIDSWDAEPNRTTAPEQGAVNASDEPAIQPLQSASVDPMTPLIPVVSDATHVDDRPEITQTDRPKATPMPEQLALADVQPARSVHRSPLVRTKQAKAPAASKAAASPRAPSVPAQDAAKAPSIQPKHPAPAPRNASAADPVEAPTIPTALTEPIAAPPRLAALVPPDGPAVASRPDLTSPWAEPADTGPAPNVARIPAKKPKSPTAFVRAQERTSAKTKKTKTAKRATKPGKSKPTLKSAKTTRRAAKNIEAKPAPAPTGTGTAQSQKLAALKPGGGVAQQNAGYSKAAVDKATTQYKRAVGRAIGKQKRYPRQAKRRGTEGRPVVRIVLDAKGRLISASLATSSGSGLLDKAALDAVKAVGRYPRIPKEMGRAKATLRFPIVFRLR